MFRCWLVASPPGEPLSSTSSICHHSDITKKYCTAMCSPTPPGFWRAQLWHLLLVSPLQSKRYKLQHHTAKNLPLHKSCHWEWWEVGMGEYTWRPSRAKLRRSRYTSCFVWNEVDRIENFRHGRPESGWDQVSVVCGVPSRVRHLPEPWKVVTWPMTKQYKLEVNTWDVQIFAGMILSKGVQG